MHIVLPLIEVKFILGGREGGREGGVRVTQDCVGQQEQAVTRVNWPAAYNQLSSSE